MASLEYTIDGKSAEKAYQDMEADRSPYLDRARQVAKLTLPHILTDQGFKGATLPTPYQSVGARGVSSLASKLLLALFPPSQSFVRLQLPSELQLAGTVSEGEIQDSMAEIERIAMSEMEAASLRPYLHEALKHLIIAGNVLLYLPIDKRSKVFHLDRFVIKRDPAGNILAIITKECISPKMLPQEIQLRLAEDQNKNGVATQTETVDIFTSIVRSDKDTYHVWQESCGCTLPNTGGTYAADALPWIPLRMDPIAGESYAYGYAAAHLGDLASLEGLMKALVEASAASARIVFLVNPNATTKISQLNSAPNGSFVAGLPDDIFPLKVDKASDMSVAFQAIERLQQSLGFAFLLNQSVQRSGERVTAEEIRFLAQELEDVLAGTYALLSQELQLRVINVLLDRLQAMKKIPKLPKGTKPVIVTGIEALGRSHDFAKLQGYMQMATGLFGPDIASQYVNVGEFLKRAGVASGLITKGLIRSEEEVQQSNAAAQQQAMMQQVAPEVVKQVGTGINQRNAQQNG